MSVIVVALATLVFGYFYDFKFQNKSINTKQAEASNSSVVINSDADWQQGTYDPTKLILNSNNLSLDTTAPLVYTSLYSDPTSDVLKEWTSTGLNNYSEVSKNTRYPDIPDTTHYLGIDSYVAKTDIYEMANVDLEGNKVSTINVYIYSASEIDHAVIFVDISLDGGSNWEGQKGIGLGSSNWTWRGDDITWTGLWTQSQIDNLQLKLMKSTLSAECAAIYAEIQYGDHAATHTSSATQLDGGTHFKNWTTFAPSGTVPVNTSINFRFRTSPDHATWGSWTASTASAASIDISSLLGAADAAKRYLQVETTLANTDGTSTPTLDAYTANYNYAVLDHVVVTPATTSVAVGGTQALTAVAHDDFGDEMPSATFSWVSDCGSVDATGSTVTFTAPAAVPIGNTCTVTVSSTVDGVTKSDDSTVSVSANSPPETCSDGIKNQNETDTDCGGVCPACPSTPPEETGNCILGSITHVKIQQNSFSLYAGDSKTLGVNFFDSAGNLVDKSSIANFTITPDFGASFWNINSGGGRLINENTSAYQTDFIAGGSRGTFDKTIVFSACGGRLIAYATPTVNKQSAIYADIEPESYALEPSESHNFFAKVSDDTGAILEDGCSYVWGLSDPAAANIDNPRINNPLYTANDHLGEYTVTLEVKCAGMKALASARLAILNIDESSVWRLESYFATLNTVVGQKTYVGFIPNIKTGTGNWYSRVEPLDFAIADPSAAKIVGLRPKYPNIPIVEATKVGCYPFLVQATLNKFGKSYIASTSINISSDDSVPPYNQFQLTLGNSALNYQHIVKKRNSEPDYQQIVKKNGVVTLSLQRKSASGNNYSIKNDIYLTLPMLTSWILNDSRLGSLQPNYSSSFIDVSYLPAGFYPKAITTVTTFNGTKKIENWDIWIEDHPDKIAFSSSLPSTIRIKPNSYFRYIWQGYQFENWHEQIDNNYKISYINSDALSVVNSASFESYLFKSGSKDGTFANALTLTSMYDGSLSSGDSEKNITVIVDSNAPSEICSDSGFLPIKPKTTTSTATSSNDNADFAIQDIIEKLSSIANKMQTALFLLFASLASATLLLNYFSNFQSFLVKGKDKRHVPGIVYDVSSGLGIANSIIMLYRSRDKKLIASTKSDKNGRFALETPSGEEYFLQIKKEGYELLSKSSASQPDLAYSNNYYYDQNFWPNDSEMLFTKAIPLKMNSQIATTLSKLNLIQTILRILRIINVPIFLFGFGFSLLALLGNKSIYNWTIFSFYIAIAIFEIVRVIFFAGRGNGYIYDSSTNQPIDLAIIRIISETSGKLVRTTVANSKGKFALSVPKGFYKIYVSKFDYKPYSTSAVRIKNSFSPINIRIPMFKEITVSKPLLAEIPNWASKASPAIQQTFSDSKEIIEHFQQKMAKYNSVNLADVGVHHLISESDNNREDENLSNANADISPLNNISSKNSKPNWQLPNSKTPM